MMPEEMAEILTRIRCGEDRWRLGLLASSVCRWLSFEDLALVFKDPAYSGVGRPLGETRTTRYLRVVRDVGVTMYGKNNRYRLTHRGKLVVSYAVIRQEWTAKELVEMLEALSTRGRRVWQQDRILAPEYQRMQVILEVIDHGPIGK
jgi:hypothetical protein